MSLKAVAEKSESSSMSFHLKISSALSYEVDMLPVKDRIRFKTHLMLQASLVT